MLGRRLFIKKTTKNGQLALQKRVNFNPITLSSIAIQTGAQPPKTNGGFYQVIGQLQLNGG
jgi:hypothetical protein